MALCLSAPAAAQSKSKKQLEKEKTQLEGEIKTAMDELEEMLK